MFVCVSVSVDVDVCVDALVCIQLKSPATRQPLFHSVTKDAN